jgi:hypothetical protein
VTMVPVLFFLAYTTGCFLTGLRMSDLFVSEDLRSVELGDSGHSEDSTMVYAMWVIFMAALWPVYWTGRLVFAGADQLMLPPGGDSV